MISKLKNEKRNFHPRVSQDKSHIAGLTLVTEEGVSINYDTLDKILLNNKDNSKARKKGNLRVSQTFNGIDDMY